jgi:hypothetical protein
MLKTIKGVYHSGKIELEELPKNVPEGTSVIVTFLSGNQASGRDVRYPLRGKPIRYINPFESVAENDWDVLR